MKLPGRKPKDEADEPTEAEVEAVKGALILAVDPGVSEGDHSVMTVTEGDKTTTYIDGVEVKPK